jgi:hypothetical protein
MSFGRNTIAVHRIALTVYNSVYVLFGLDHNLRRRGVVHARGDDVSGD